MWPKHGDQRGGERYDRPSMAWVPADEWQRRQWEREDRVFAKAANQGELCCPSVISDNIGGVRGLQSQVDGRMYDSKSNLRRHYRQSGVIEVGGQVPTTRFWHGDKPRPDAKLEAGKERAIHRAFNRMGVPPV